MQFPHLGRFPRAVGRLKFVRPLSGPAVSTQKPLALRAIPGAFFKVPALKLIKGQACGDSRPSLNEADDLNYLVFAVSYPTREPLNYWTIEGEEISQMCHRLQNWKFTPMDFSNH